MFLVQIFVNHEKLLTLTPVKGAVKTIWLGGKYGRQGPKSENITLFTLNIQLETLEENKFALRPASI